MDSRDMGHVHFQTGPERASRGFDPDRGQPLLAGWISRWNSFLLTEIETSLSFLSSGVIREMASSSGGVGHYFSETQLELPSGAILPVIRRHHGRARARILLPLPRRSNRGRVQHRSQEE
ncbi:unnamed protein product [Arctogadus glacialis]